MFPRLKAFYYECLSIKYGIFGVASFLGVLYVGNGHVYPQTIFHNKVSKVGSVYEFALTSLEPLSKLHRHVVRQTFC